MFDIILVALLQAAAGDPAPPAQDTTQTQEAPASAAPAQPPAEQQVANADNTVRCRRERLSGSRVMQRVCTTAQQDADMRSDARQMINRAQSQGRAD